MIANAIDFETDNGQAVSYPHLTANDLTSGDFTVEGWIKLESYSFSPIVIATYNASEGDKGWLMYGDATYTYFGWYDGGWKRAIWYAPIPLGTWIHLAGVHDATAGTITLYINGTKASETTEGGGEVTGVFTNPLAVTTGLYIGKHITYGAGDGLYQNFRISNNKRYISNFVSSTALFLNDVNTLFLCTFNNTINDISGNGLIGTFIGSGIANYVNGFLNETAAIETKALDLELNDVQYISYPYEADLDITSGDFTVEFWFKPESQGEYAKISTDWNDIATGWHFLISGHNPAWLYFGWNPGTNVVSSPPNLTTGTWSHIAGVFDDTANTLQIFIDGILKATQTGVTDNPLASTQGLRIGFMNGGRSLDGLIQNVRISNFKRYTVAFTPSVELFRPDPYTLFLATLNEHLNDTSPNALIGTFNGTGSLTYSTGILLPPGPDPLSIHTYPSPKLMIAITDICVIYHFLRTGEKETYDIFPYATEVKCQITPATPDLLSLYPDVPVGQLFDIFSFASDLIIENGDKFVDEDNNEYIIRGVPAIYDVPNLGMYFVRLTGVKMEKLE